MGAGPSAEPLGALLDHLAANLDPLTDRVIGCFRSEIEAYAGLPEPELRPGVRANIERAIDALARDGDPTPAETEAARALGEHRARQGVSLEAVLQAHRIGVREAIAAARRRAAETGVGAEVVLDLATKAWAWIDVVVLSAARGHRQQELDLASQEQQQRAHLLRGLLHGLLEEAGLRTAALTHGIDPHEAYTPLCARGTLSDLRQLERAITTRAAEAGITVLAAPLDDGLAAVLGAADATAVEPVASGALDEIGESVLGALGMPARPAELGPAYSLTRRALEAARALGRRGLVRLPDLTLYAAVLAQPEISTLLCQRCMVPLEREGDFGAELLSTLEAWFAHGMRTEETAASLPVHANTLRYRLRRVEEITGVSLGTTTGRFEMWWALNSRRITPGA